MIKHLIFDFGDVFINLDKTAATRTFEALGIPQFDSKITKFNENYEIGKVSTAAFIAQYQQWYPTLTASQITNSWNAILLDFPKYRLDFIKNLAATRQYTLLLLSNTNALHIQWIMDNVPFYEEFKACFDHFYLSHELQLRKPNQDIFEYVLYKHQLNPKETLFIDDTAENTKSAAKLGISVWNNNPRTEDVINLFTLKKSIF